MAHTHREEGKLTKKIKAIESIKIILTSFTKKAWKPIGTLCGISMTATGSADIVLASITCAEDFLTLQTIIL